MKVRVKTSIQDHFSGFFEHARRRTGDVFSIPDAPRRLPFPGEQKAIESSEETRAVYDAIKDKDGKIPKAFSFRWMEPAAASEGERISTAQGNMDKRAEEIRLEKAGAREAVLSGGKGAKDVI